MDIFKQILSDSVRSGTCMHINEAVTTGSISIGIGYSQMTEFLVGLDIPSMSSKTYQKCHKKVSSAAQNAALSSIKEAHDAEIELAIKEGRVDDEGRPWITVVVDGQWCKRCYRTKYDSLSGVVSIL